MSMGEITCATRPRKGHAERQALWRQVAQSLDPGADDHRLQLTRFCWRGRSSLNKCSILPGIGTAWCFQFYLARD